MRLLKSGDGGAHMSNDVVDVAVIAQDVAEVAVIMGNVRSRKSENMCLSSAFMC